MSKNNPEDFGAGEPYDPPARILAEEWKEDGS
jgi:hypothetical protein